eukprot:CAMPEP_0119341480 /NCGR_PEP_ID=MMETSP1333-20130426/102523_1 /TAXON_ID=418940 /ORGANISM="Scyphosphaera apsteinii, Strain RCC1455" /LENGTH=34 /DNA_ID= /DNA_START= /DNA_END= /DNA_ORIENTATION=
MEKDVADWQKTVEDWASFSGGLNDEMKKVFNDAQ